MDEKLSDMIQLVCSTSKYYGFYDIYSMRCIMLILQHNIPSPVKLNFSLSPINCLFLLPSYDHALVLYLECFIPSSLSTQILLFIPRPFKKTEL